MVYRPRPSSRCTHSRGVLHIRHSNMISAPICYDSVSGCHSDRVDLMAVVVAWIVRLCMCQPRAMGL